ncbi:MAG: hypothetical protein HYR94_03815 [Chloroflexi bacterium]|nr:hypothetical protein [Chloroflexota bacterium]
MDPASALLLFILFKATEKTIGSAGGKIADAMSKPVWEALEDKAKWLAGQDDTAKRWPAFSQAFTEARTRFVDTAPNPEVARQVASLFETTNFNPKKQADRYLLEKLAAELEKASLLVEEPNVKVITELCVAVLQRQGELHPRHVDLTDAISHFVDIFQGRLFAQAAYSDSMIKGALWQYLRQSKHSRPKPPEPILKLIEEARMLNDLLIVLEDVQEHYFEFKEIVDSCAEIDRSKISMQNYEVIMLLYKRIPENKIGSVKEIWYRVDSHLKELFENVAKIGLLQISDNGQVKGPTNLISIYSLYNKVKAIIEHKELTSGSIFDISGEIRNLQEEIWLYKKRAREQLRNKIIEISTHVQSF